MLWTCNSLHSCLPSVDVRLCVHSSVYPSVTGENCVRFHATFYQNYFARIRCCDRYSKVDPGLEVYAIFSAVWYLCCVICQSICRYLYLSFCLTVMVSYICIVVCISVSKYLDESVWYVCLSIFMFKGTVKEKWKGVKAKT